MTVRRENWNNPEFFKAVIIIGIVMTRFGSLQWTCWGRTPTNMAFLRATLQHINDILHSADYKARVLSSAFMVSVNLKQNTKPWIETKSCLTQRVCNVLCHASDSYGTTSSRSNSAYLNILTWSGFFQVLQSIHVFMLFLDFFFFFLGKIQYLYKLLFYIAKSLYLAKREVLITSLWVLKINGGVFWRLDYCMIHGRSTSCPKLDYCCPNIAQYKC